MAKTVNKVILVGRLGADPDVKYSGSGTAVAKLSIATTEWQGEGKEPLTEWHRAVLFGKTAEAAGNHLHKGSLVFIEGKLRTNQWEDQNGVKRFTTEIIAGDVVFLSGKDDSGPQGQSQQQSQYAGKRGGSGPRPSAHEQAKANGYQPQADDSMPF